MEIITIASAKGGVGKSVFCCGVGKMLSLMDKKTLLIDMDIGVRSLDILLGVADKTVYNWGDILKGNCDYGKAILPVAENFFLLPAPMELTEDYTEESFKTIFDKICDEFDYVLLDSPAGLEKGFEMSVSVAHSCIIMATPDAVSMRAASYASQSVKKQNVSDVRLVINRFDKKLHKNADVDYYIDTVSARLLGIIPDSCDVYKFSIGEKIPYESKVNQAFLRIARRICGENIPLRISKL